MQTYSGVNFFARIVISADDVVEWVVECDISRRGASWGRKLKYNRVARHKVDRMEKATSLVGAIMTSTVLCKCGTSRLRLRSGIGEEGDEDPLTSTNM